MSKETKVKRVVLCVVGILIALYVLFPFYLVVMNSFKAQTSIVASPVSLAGASFKQLAENLGADGQKGWHYNSQPCSSSYQGHCAHWRRPFRVLGFRRWRQHPSHRGVGCSALVEL